MPASGSSAPIDQNLDDASREELVRALRHAEARLAGVVDIAADAILSTDADQRIVYCNHGAEQIFGWSAGELIGQPLEVLLPVGARASHRGHVAGFGAGQQQARRMGHRRAIAGRRRSGDEFPAEASISKHTVEGETYYHVVLRDVTEQRRIESHQRFLARAGELLTVSLDVDRTLERAAALAVPALGDACLIWLQGGERLDLAAVARLGTTPPDDELRARLERQPIPLASTHPAAGVAHARGSARQLLHGTAPPDSDDAAPGLAVWDALAEARAERALPADAPLHALLVSVSAGGESNGVLALYRHGAVYDDDEAVLAEDFARRLALGVDNARLYERAQRAIRARDETMAVVSHDLRNPVNAIAMLAGALGRQAADPARTLAHAREELATISMAARQADALIQDLLDVARLEAGTLRLEAGPVELAALIRQAATLLRPLAADRELELVAHVPPEPAPVTGDAERLQQVLSNLVGNAVKFTAAGGRVEIRLEPGAHEHRVSVVDTGQGIAPEQLPHVFDRYWQGGARSRRGAGLGLAIAKGIVDAHGGRIWVESEPGVGSTFHVSLPA